MPACPKCMHPHIVKAGKARGNQRWRCRGCGYPYTRATPGGRPLWQTARAVCLDGHGVALHVLGKRFGVRASAVLHWSWRFAMAYAATPKPVGNAMV